MLILSGLGAGPGLAVVRCGHFLDRKVFYEVHLISCNELGLTSWRIWRIFSVVARTIAG